MKKGHLLSNFILFITTHPWWILLIITLAVSAMAGGVVNLGFKNDYRAYFSQENPQLQAFEDIQNTYNKSDSVMFVLQPEDGNAFSRETLQAIQELTEKAWKIPFSSRVDSITNFQHTQADGDDLLVADLVADPGVSAVEIENIKKIALDEPILANRLVSLKADVAGVNVILQMPGDDPDEVTSVAAAARELVKEIEAGYPGMKVYLTGMAMMSNAFSESAMNDNKLLVPLMYACVILVLLLSLRSISATIAVVLLIIFSILSALGLAGWLGWFLTPTSAIAPTIILTMAVADCVHLLITQLHNMRIGHKKRQAIQESLRVNFQPIFLTSLTTSIGFLSMNFSDAPPFRDLGNIVAIGVMLAWLFSISFLPALMMILPVRVKLQDELDNSMMNKLAGWLGD